MTDKEKIIFLNQLEDKSQLICRINTATCKPFGLPPEIKRTNVTVADIIDILNRQQAEIENLEYKLLGVMHFVDKWLDGAELEQDEVNRASAMREKTLQIVEKQQAEIEKLSNELKITRDYIHHHNLEYDLLSYSERNGG